MGSGGALSNGYRQRGFTGAAGPTGGVSTNAVNLDLIPSSTGIVAEGSPAAGNGSSGDERPNCAGWYWFKSPGIEEPRLVYVDNGRIDAKLMADLGPPNNLVDVNRIKGQWAGPLEPPS